MPALNHRPRWIRRGLIIAVLMGLESGYAASMTNEHFSAGAAGWIGKGTMAFSASAGSLKGSFPLITMPSIDAGSFVATNTSSAGAFVGDWSGAGAGVLGFSFNPVQKIPDEAIIRFTGPGGSFYRNVKSYLTETGVWYRFAISLNSRPEGSWVGGSDSAFLALLSDVRWLEMYVRRSGLGYQEYLLDDVLLVPAASAGALAPAPGNVIQITWEDLISNAVYDVQGWSGSATSAWTTVQVVTGGAGSVSSVLGDGDVHHYRLSLPEVRRDP